MKRTLLILLAAASVASAQTFITVTADTNRVVRTNFSLVRSQISDLSGASFAISNITGLQTALDGKMTTNGSAAGLTNFPASLLTTNGDAAGLTNFPASLLRTNGSAGALTNFPASLLTTNGSAAALTNFPAAILQTNSALTNFPAGLLRTNGDGSGLTNLPNANLSNAIGVLPVSNGGSGATNAGEARTNFALVWQGLTNADAAGFRTALSLGTAATNDASAFQQASASLTNLANNNGGNLTNVSVDLTAVLPSYSNNVGKVLAVATGATNVEWTAVSNTITDASTLTNFPASILQTSSAETNFPSFLLRTNGNASGLTFPATLLTTNGNGAGLTNLTAANITGTVALATNVSGTVAIANGGTGGTTASNARVNLLPNYTGNASRVLALNSNATDVVWAVDGGGVADMSNVTNTLGIANGGTGATNVLTALTNLAILGGSSSVHIAPTTTNAVGNFNVTIGVAAAARPSTTGSVILGYSASADDGGESGAVAIGRAAVSTNGVAIGYGANNFVSTGGRGVAIGYLATNNASGAAQIGSGRNTNASTIQFLTAGSVDTNEWSALATLSTQGRYAMTNTAGISGTKTFVAYDGTNYSTNSVTISNGIITGWTQ